MRDVGIVGNGYVGSGLATMLKDAYRIHIYDPGKGYTSMESFRDVELAIICVPTPSHPDGHANIDLVADSIAWLPREIPHIVIKSTVPPGTTDALSKRFGRPIHFSPEYMGEPTSFVPPWKYPDPRHPESHSFCIVGGPNACEVLAYFARVMSSDAKMVPTTAVAAECAKYMENSYYAMKVAFCHEWAGIAQAFGVEYMLLRHLWLHDPRIDPDHTRVLPDSFGYGGKCLPKDMAAIICAAGDAGICVPVLEGVHLANRRAVNGDA